jgi:hypothetical protein
MTYTKSYQLTFPHDFPTISTILLNNFHLFFRIVWKVEKLYTSSLPGLSKTLNLSSCHLLVVRWIIKGTIINYQRYYQKLSIEDYNAFLIVTKLEYQLGFIKEESTSELLRFTIRHLLNQLRNDQIYHYLEQQ